MSKNFEKEYRDYLNAQAPDLWDRIEKGIGEIEAAGENSNNVVPLRAAKAGEKSRIEKKDAGEKSRVEKKDAGERNSKSKNKSKNKSKSIPLRFWTSAAACLLALCLAVPVWRIVKQDSVKSADKAMEMKHVGQAETVAEACEEETAATDAADEAAEVPETGVAEIAVTQQEEAEMSQEDALTDMPEQMAAAENGQYEEQGVGLGMDRQTEGKKDAGTGADNGGDTVNETAAQHNASEEQLVPEEEEAELLSLFVHISSVSTETERYQAVVMQTADGIAAEGETITLMPPSGISFGLKENTAYRIEVRPSDEPGTFELISAVEE